ncbi:hypothetical protein LY76DRAFT_312456 [Colletotrichum caudatum]|nr:hypothetical protein LY76DRAFT_312456 [Colletotrichum caudatum]
MTPNPQAIPLQVPTPINTESPEPGLIWQSICGPTCSCFCLHPTPCRRGRSIDTRSSPKSFCSNHQKKKKTKQPGQARPLPPSLIISIPEKIINECCRMRTIEADTNAGRHKHQFALFPQNVLS